MSKKKIFIIAIILIITIGAVIGGIYVDRESKKEENLKNEISEVNKLLSDPNRDEEKINEMLDRTISDGEYARVEVAAKKYLKDSMNSLDDLIKMMEDEKIIKMLSIENYKKDGPDFKESLAYISSYREKLKTTSNALLWFVDKEKINEYINNQNLNDDNKKLLKELLVTEESIDSEYASIVESVEMVKELLDKEEKVLVFLKDNQNNWRIKKKEMMFTTDKLLKEYNELTNSIQGEK